MKKYLIIILSFILFPCVVLAEECDGITPDEPVKSQSELINLQREYNTWSTSGNTGKTCIKVIAIQNGNSRSYMSGKNPSNNYKCSDGSQAIAKFIATSLAEEDAKTECANENCYIPEIWLMDCGTSGSNGSTNTENTNNDNVNSGDINSDDVSTNNNGQITGTTDSSDTGVETYFVILFIMSVMSYLILTVSKKKNLFKSI